MLEPELKIQLACLIHSSLISVACDLDLKSVCEIKNFLQGWEVWNTRTKEMGLVQ